MSVAASPPPAALPPSPTAHAQSPEDLDDEIIHIREQIQELTKRRRLVSSSLLSSSKIQAQLNTTPYSNNLDEKSLQTVSEIQDAAQENVHRIAFGVTSFRYTDPSPHTSNVPLLGVRIDICSRTGMFGKPYYLLLKRVNDKEDDLRIYRHTIPAHISLPQQYLPLRDEGYGSEEVVSDGFNTDTNATNSKQNLHLLVQKVRHDLVSWNLRREAIELLAEELGLVPEAATDLSTGEAVSISYIRPDETSRQTGVQSVSAIEVEARLARVTWVSGQLARLKISDKGTVERALVYGVETMSRLKHVEKVLVGDGDVKLEELARLLKLY